MKNFLRLVFLLTFLPLMAVGQDAPFFRNDGALSAIGNPNKTPSVASVDANGRLFSINTDGTTGASESVIPISGATALTGIGAGSIGWEVITASTTATGGSTTTITTAANTARIGDVVVMQSGTAANIGAWSEVTAQTNTLITVGHAFPAAVVNTDTFKIMRPVPISAFTIGAAANTALNVSIDSGNNTVATGLLKLEDAASASGNAGVFVLAARNSAMVSLTSADGDYGAFAVDTTGKLGVNLNITNTDFPTLGNPIRAEDSPFLDTGAVMVAGTIRNDNAATSYGGTDQDVQPLASDINGKIYARIMSSDSRDAVKVEDVAAVDSEAGIPPLFVREDALLSDTSASGDYGWAKIDSSGRLITTLASQNEGFESCGTATAVTSDVAIKASVASNRIYTTSITCKNTSTTVGPTLDFKDGATIIAVGGITATSATGATPASFTAIFPVPLRGTAATALNFATNTATTSVTCCAHGYISTQ